MLYIENIDNDSGATKKEISNDVRRYVCDGNVKVLDCFVIFNKYRSDKCGCKITIPTKDIDILMSEVFWPHGISCRIWEERTKPGFRGQKRFQSNWQRSETRHAHDEGDYNRDYERDNYEDYDYGYDHRQ